MVKYGRKSTAHGSGAMRLSSASTASLHSVGLAAMTITGSPSSASSHSVHSFISTPRNSPAVDAFGGG
eukprot:9125742-Pyramimonas_sp.AAC.1